MIAPWADTLAASHSLSPLSNAALADPNSSQGNCNVELQRSRRSMHVH
jgi:hypothetical protein